MKSQAVTTWTYCPEPHLLSSASWILCSGPFCSETPFPYSKCSEAPVLIISSLAPSERKLTKHCPTPVSIPAWKVPWTGEPGELQTMGSQRVRHYWTSQEIQLLVKPEQNQPADGVNPQPLTTLNQTSPPTNSGVSATGTPSYITALLVSLQNLTL